VIRPLRDISVTPGSSVVLNSTTCSNCSRGSVTENVSSTTIVRYRSSFSSNVGSILKTASAIPSPPAFFRKIARPASGRYLLANSRRDICLSVCDLITVAAAIRLSFSSAVPLSRMVSLNALARSLVPRGSVSHGCTQRKSDIQNLAASGNRCLACRSSTVPRQNDVLAGLPSNTATLK
jgi:hypothetical protein